MEYQNLTAREKASHDSFKTQSDQMRYLRKVEYWRNSRKEEFFRGSIIIVEFIFTAALVGAVLWMWFNWGSR